jgi:hypothetical protein
MLQMAERPDKRRDMSLADWYSGRGAAVLMRDITALNGGV